MKEQSAFEKRVQSIYEKYAGLSLQGKIDVIAQTFGCKTGEIRTSPCTGKWRGTSDMSIHFDNGESLFIGNHLTPKAKTVKVQTECVNGMLARYNPEIVQVTKETALPALLRREPKDNEIAAQKGLKPYKVLNVELNTVASKKNGSYLGWYYVTLAVDGKICTHMETGLNHAIADGMVNNLPTRANYFTAGALKEPDVDYVFNNVGFSSASSLYTVQLREDVRKRAEETLAKRMEQERGPNPAARETGETVHTPRGTFHVTDMSREDMEAAGYGYHHQTEDGRYLIMGNGTRAFAISSGLSQEITQPDTLGGWLLCFPSEEYTAMGEDTPELDQDDDLEL